MTKRKILIELSAETEDDFTAVLEEITEQLVESSLFYQLAEYNIEEIPENAEFIRAAP